jgi:hypothetical protein
MYCALAEIPCVWPFFGGTATSSALPPVYTNSENASEAGRIGQGAWAALRTGFKEQFPSIDGDTR